MVEDATRTAAPGAAAGPGATAPSASPPGYELHEEIGRGGMGVVYRARDIDLDRDVAVKLLAERYPADSPAAQRFVSEARITGQLQHPGIPAVHQVGALADGRPFLAMKLIKGSTLEAILKFRADPAAQRGQLLAIFEAVCQAVGYAHAHRVIHRDLKPANVMVGAFGEVQVMDWGLAKVLGEETPAASDALTAEETQAWTQVIPTPEAGSHTQAGSMLGTPAFAPPEQVGGEIERVNERSDVFGLGALLVVMLTGQPPYVGESSESVRVQALRGKLEDCFARLDSSGAEPELVSLCKKCLAFEPADRPANAGSVAAAVAGLRAAADERAQRAELERVRVEGEKAMAAAQSAERRKRQRLALVAAAILALAALGGLSVVLAVQRQAKNRELADEQAKVEARFEMAQKAIALIHTGVSEDMLLKNAEFAELRMKLLKEVAGFYADLEKLLAGQTDAKSRKVLADGYTQLGELTEKIGDQGEALAVQRRALAIRRELAATVGADVEARLNVARSLHLVGELLLSTGEAMEALAAWEELRAIAAALEAESPTDAVRAVLAQSHVGIGLVLLETGKLAEALAAYEQARAIRQKLADANPAATQFQSDLAMIHNSIGRLLSRTGKPAAALAAFEQARAIHQKLADANPTVTRFQNFLTYHHANIGLVLANTGKPAEALEAFGKALAIEQKLADAHPAVTNFQWIVALLHDCIGNVLYATGKPAEALAAYQQARAIHQKLADAHPSVIDYQSDLARSYIYLGRLYARQKRFAEAFAALARGLAPLQKLADAHPTLVYYSTDLGFGYAYRGWANGRAGHPAEAASDLRHALGLWVKEKSPAESLASGNVPFERARALALLAGLGGDAKSGVTKEEAKIFADRAIAALREAIQTGWNVPDELQEPDFDALRDRDDFKKLVAEVVAKAKPAAAKDK